MGALERNHAVRRELLAIFAEKIWETDMKYAVIITCAARKRLHNARGFSPMQRVFGTMPRMPCSLDEEYFNAGGQRTSWTTCACGLTLVRLTARPT